MNDYAKQTEEFIKNTQKMTTPEGVQQAMEDNLNKTRDAYSKFSEMATDTTKAFESFYATTQKGTKDIADKILAQTTANTKSAFEAAEAVLKTKSVPEAAQIQAEYLKKQFEVLSEQSKELYEMSNKVAADTAESLNSATTKAFDQTK